MVAGFGRGGGVEGVHSGVCILSKEMFIDCMNERNNRFIIEKVVEVLKVLKVQRQNLINLLLPEFRNL